MPHAPSHVVTVILRRMRQEARPEVIAAHARLRAAAARADGFLGAQDSWLPPHGDEIDLVTVFSFRSRRDLEAWDRAPERQRLIADLDRHCLDISERAAFDGLALLQPDRVRVSKPETVAILIGLILTLGWLADLLLPPFPEPGRTVLAVSVNVCLISYVFLPWSIRLLDALKRKAR
ncbi:MAG TPA: hypothetical protein DD444_12580 [Citreicella sp.]|jgi:antibiotic biosynthesis monooxygenase (ABM) superfamily enzyme|nr:hypothetical protein [Citreicella sp.]